LASLLGDHEPVKSAQAVGGHSLSKRKSILRISCSPLRFRQGTPIRRLISTLLIDPRKIQAQTRNAMFRKSECVNKSGDDPAISRHTMGERSCSEAYRAKLIG
jgi:hypothetical protein